MDGTEIGSFGTLRLMKRTTNEQVAAFPIDEETVTFGRELTCSVRLYYPDVSALHAKLVFRERKAFLIVLGEAGLTIDGCPVLPSANPSLPTTIPVSNNCEIEIHKKRFIFSYPPKELRAPLYNIDSPIRPENGTGERRKLRMSMIHSAQVFTPRGQPSSDPLTNLRVLQSPIKQLVPSPRKPSALKHTHFPEQDEVEEEIVLVESNTPHVVQEEKDLVILEHVDVPAPLPPTPLVRRPRPSVNMYQTPNRRTRPSLHRAVLIRSVQRAVMAREEEQEEKEVVDEIVGEEEAEEAEECEDHSKKDEHSDDNDRPAEDDRETFEDEHSPELDTDDTTPQPSTWRKSLDAMRSHVGWPFRSSSTAPEEDDEDNGQDEGEDEEDEHIQVDNDQPLPPPSSSSPPAQTIPPQVQPHLTPARLSRPLGSFMTPQVTHSQPGVGIGRGVGRNSFGGALRVPLPPGISTLTPPEASALDSAGAVETWGGAKRVRIEPKWRIGDIDVGAQEENPELSSGMGRKRVSISEEERRAIQQRRKSALTTPDPFFAQVPGLRRLSVAPSVDDGNTPKKLPSLLDSAVRTVGERIASPMKLDERSASPTKSGERSTSSTKFASPTKAPSLSRSASPTKSFHASAKAFESPARGYLPSGRSVSPMKAPLTPHSEEDEEDTRSLLDRMKRTVEEIKRRRSIGLFEHDEREEEHAEIADTEPCVDVENSEGDIEEDHQSGEEEENSDKENGQVLPPRSSLSPELEPRATATSPQTPAPLSPTCVALDLDLELERTPLPQLTRPAETSRRQYTNTFSGFQTPALTSVKHLFPPPAPVPSTPAVKSMRALFRGKSTGAGISEEGLDGVEEMMVTPEGYRTQHEEVPQQEVNGDVQTREGAREMGKEKEERKPTRTTSRKTPVPAFAPTTTTVRRPTTRAAVPIGPNGREPSASRPPSRTERVPSKRTQTVLPKCAGKEAETVPGPEPVPVPVVSAKEQDEATPQLAVQKKPVRARLLRAHKGTAAETSDDELPAVRRTRDASIEPRTRPTSTEPRTRPASIEPRTRAATTRKAQVGDVDTVTKTRATRSRATPVPMVRSEPAKMRARPAPKSKAAARALPQTKIRSAEDDDDANDPLDSIGLPEAPATTQRTRRTRAATAPVKEEEVDGQIPVPVLGKAKSATTTRRRGTAVVDKENTPSSSKEDESERKKEVEVKRTTRATRSRA